ncbi:MAG: protease [Marine Group III euryarchaeote CG-Epi2]|uniref:Protease HtpX homolog n=1 Tax=Marine Group III euryarchaeote CG-Epi2 TaxID=1888996 RepID=A0A1J5TMM5_9ARCH|nr:MAG: protease [Marine Group III euryarchaeote CG-Epi2]|tara:strand:- start:970 stop:1803 length:834 start_codon:yes stop_codon:yes gene_type:complete
MAIIRLFGLYFMLTLLMMIVGFVAAGSSSGIIIFAIFGLIINIYSYFYSDSLVLRAYGAKIIERQDNPRLYGIVKKISDLNGLPVPRIAIVPSSTPNAFATGRNPKNAVVAATTGIMSILDDNELEGVMAHEMAHVKNRDTLVMCVAATIAGFIAFAARMLWWNSMFGGRNRNVHPALMILVMLTAPLAAFLLQMAVSRSREYHADATAAKLTNKPWALISALKKLEWENHRKPLDCGSPSNAAMCIVNPLRGKDFFVNMFSTHPPMEKRIKALEKL